MDDSLLRIGCQLTGISGDVERDTQAEQHQGRGASKLGSLGRIILNKMVIELK